MNNNQSQEKKGSQSDLRYFQLAISVIIFFLLYNFILAFGSLEGSPKHRIDRNFFPYLSEKPLTEDGYYMLTVAWNIAAGKGIVYNYDIETTGIQPLATFLYSVIAFIVQRFNGDKYSFARAIIIFSSFLQLLFAYLIYRIAISISKNPAKGLYFLLSVLVVLLNFKLLLIFDNGLETGLYLILLSTFFLYWLYLITITPVTKHYIITGLLTGLLILCRLDSMLIWLFFYFILLIRGTLKLKHLAVILLVAFLMYLPWQLYIWKVTGNLLQSSVRSQTSLFIFYDHTFKIEEYFISIIQHITPFLYTGNIILWPMFLFGLIYIILLIIGYKKYSSTVLTDLSKKMLIILLIPFLILLIIYFIFSHAPYFYFRYFVFLSVVSLPLCITLFAFLLKKFNQINKGLLVLIVLVGFIIQAYLYLNSGKSSLAFAVRTEFVKSHFNIQNNIAAYQTGVLGYYCENVINLDGKMNNEALLNSNHSKMGQYLDSMKINVLIEWIDILQNNFDEKYLNDNWLIYKVDIGDGRTICYVRN